jgi:hypothetical protein
VQSFLASRRSWYCEVETTGPIFKLPEFTIPLRITWPFASVDAEPIVNTVPVRNPTRCRVAVPRACGEASSLWQHSPVGWAWLRNEKALLEGPAAIDSTTASRNETTGIPHSFERLNIIPPFLTSQIGRGRQPMANPCHHPYG